LGVGKNKRSVARCRSDAGKSIPEMMRRKITGGSDARKNIRGSEAASQEASQVNRHGSTVLRQEVAGRKAGFARRKDPSRGIMLGCENQLTSSS